MRIQQENNTFPLLSNWQSLIGPSGISVVALLAFGAGCLFWAFPEDIVLFGSYYKGTTNTSHEEALLSWCGYQIYLRIAPTGSWFSKKAQGCDAV